MELKQIGIIHSPYIKGGDAPRQGRLQDSFKTSNGRQDQESGGRKDSAKKTAHYDIFEIEVFSEFAEGLKDIETVSHLIVLYWCNQAQRDVLTVITPWHDAPRGVFITRSPARPNPIAFDIVDFIKREGNVLTVKNMDALDGSPLLDIKPYSAKIDSIPDTEELPWFKKK